VAPPRRSGFGTILMKRAFADVDGQSRLTHEGTAPPPDVAAD
jgi:hypothetical protein